MWQVDTFRTMLSWPKNLRVADFVTEPGTYFVDGAVMEGHLACPQFSLPLAQVVAVRTTPGQAVTARVAPHAVSLATVEPPLVCGVVEWIEPLHVSRL